MLKCMILAIDGVICDLSFFHFLSWKSVFSQHGIYLSQKEWPDYKGNGRIEIATKILKKHKRKIDMKLAKAIAKEKNDTFVELIQTKLTEAQIFNGVRQLISYAIARKLKLIVVSESANAELQLKCMKLFNKFDYIIKLNQQENMSDDVSILDSLKRIGIRVDECIAIHDNLEKILTFKRNGIYTVGVTGYKDGIKKAANFSIDLIEQINFEEIIFGYYYKERPEF